MLAENGEHLLTILIMRILEFKNIFFVSSNLAMLMND